MVNGDEDQVTDLFCKEAVKDGVFKFCCLGGLGRLYMRPLASFTPGDSVLIEIEVVGEDTAKPRSVGMDGATSRRIEKGAGLCLGVLFENRKDPPMKGTYRVLEQGFLLQDFWGECRFLKCDAVGPSAIHKACDVDETQEDGIVWALAAIVCTGRTVGDLSAWEMPSPCGGIVGR